MALFTGRAGDHEAALRKFENVQAYNQRQKNLKAQRAVMRETDPEPLKVPMDPSGIIAPTVFIPPPPPPPPPVPEPAAEPAAEPVPEPVIEVVVEAPDGSPIVSEGPLPEPTSRTEAERNLAILTQRHDKIAMYFRRQVTGSNLPADLQNAGSAKLAKLQKQVADAIKQVNRFPAPDVPPAPPLPIVLDHTDPFADPDAPPVDATVAAPVDTTDLHSLAANAVANMGSILEKNEEGNYTQPNPDRDVLLLLAARLGVDPATALTIWGLETNFGAAPGTTLGSLSLESTAYGPMQVTGPTFNAMKRYFSDSRKYPLEGIANVNKAFLITLAKRMNRGNFESEFAAGLMRMKYSELIGVPPENWGAAYQAKAEDVRDNGGPLNVTDGGTTNAGYNTAFNQLRSEITRVLSGEVRPVAGLVVPEDGVVVPPPPPKPETKVVVPETAPEAVPEAAADVEPVVVVEPVVADDKKPAGVVTEGGAGPVADALTADPNKKLHEPPAYKKPVDIKLINKELAQAVTSRRELETLADIYWRSGDAASYHDIIFAMNRVTDTMTHLAQQKAINIFENQHDPRMLQQIWSVKAGYPEDYYIFVPRSDGKWNIRAGGLDGELAYEGYTTGDITSSARSDLSIEWNTSINAAGAALRAKKTEAQWSLQEKAIVKDIENRGKLAVEQLKAQNKIIVDTQTGNIWAFRGNQIFHIGLALVENPDGDEEVQTVKVIPGIFIAPTTADPASAYDQ